MLSNRFWRWAIIRVARRVGVICIGILGTVVAIGISAIVGIVVGRVSKTTCDDNVIEAPPVEEASVIKVVKPLADKRGPPDKTSGSKPSASNGKSSPTADKSSTSNANPGAAAKVPPAAACPQI